MYYSSMNEQLTFKQGAVSVSKYEFDGTCWLLFYDFTDSIQIYANKSQINALVDDLSRKTQIKSQELYCASGSIFTQPRKGRLNLIAYNEDYNISEIFMELTEDEVKKLLSLLKDVLDKWT